MPKNEAETIDLEAGDTANEMILIAAAMVDPDARAMLVKRVRPDQFLEEQHRHIWAGMQELERRKLDYEHAVLMNIVGNRVKPGYLVKVLAQFPDPPANANLEHHADTLKWDHQRALAMRGPLADLLTGLRDPSHAPERIRALARHLAEALAGTGSTLLDSKFLIAQQIDEIRKRMGGRASWPYGIPNLDFYEKGARNDKGEDIGGRARMLPGAAPGMMTVLTAVSGGGKSTAAARIALGLIEQKRKVLYAAWEPGGAMTIELMAVMSLEWNRTDVSEGMFTHEDTVVLEERMHLLSQHVVFQNNPFQRRNQGKPSNERNLDTIQQSIEDSGCEVFIADTWDRCIVDGKPDAEQQALTRQHVICEETGTHGILLAQQRMKDVETRADKRPTREGILGSQAWVTVPECILAPHLPALFKKVPNNKLEWIIWKQRWGLWPACVECDWDGEYGSITGGRTIPFEHAGEQSDLGVFVPPVQHPGGKRRKQ